MLLRSLLIALCLVGCHPAVPVRGTLDIDSPDWCFDGKFLHDGSKYRTRQCFDSLEMCTRVLGLVTKHGKRVDMTELTKCGWQR